MPLRPLRTCRRVLAGIAGMVLLLSRPDIPPLLAQDPEPPFQPPIGGTWEPVQSLGQPPRWKPYVGLGFGLDRSGSEHRSGGWLGRGGEFRFDWIPGRNHSFVAGAVIPIAQPLAGKTRPKRVSVPLPEPPRVQRLPPPREGTPLGNALLELDRSALWVVRLGTPPSSRCWSTTWFLRARCCTSPTRSGPASSGWPSSRRRRSGAAGSTWWPRR